MESQVGWLWELLIISLRIKMLLCNSIVGVSNPFFFIQLPYFYSLNSFFQTSHPQGYYVRFSMTMQLISVRTMKFVRFFLKKNKKHFCESSTNFFLCYVLTTFYVKCNKILQQQKKKD